MFSLFSHGYVLFVASFIISIIFKISGNIFPWEMVGNCFSFAMFVGECSASREVPCVFVCFISGFAFDAEIRF